MSLLTFDQTIVYYVIVGRGFSAVTNHTMLAQLGARLGGQPVLHIGGPDPWDEYHLMPMGQWPVLLEMPSSPGAFSPNTYRCLPSADFATATQNQWSALQSTRPFAYLNAKVTGIRKVSNSPIEYHLDLDESRQVKAAYIDICAGPGPAKDPCFINIDPTLKGEYDTGSFGPVGWPRVISGERFLSQKTPQAPPPRRLCFIGGGPTGAWCVERAQAQGHTEIVWLSEKNMNSAFVSSRRNDGLVAGRVLRKLKRGEHVVQGQLRPRSTTTYFGEHVSVTDLKLLTSNEVQVVIKAEPKIGRYVSRSTDYAVPTTKTFDQVVISIGQATEFSDPTSWASMLKTVLAGAVKKKSEVIRDKDGKGVGLQSDDGHLRVLGACALAHPRLRSELVTFGRPSNLYLQSLPEQARVRAGITLAAVMLAEANQFWATAPNRNLNTAGLADLKALLTGIPRELEAPQNWFDMRGGRIPPFDRTEALSFKGVRTRY